MKKIVFVLCFVLSSVSYVWAQGYTISGEVRGSAEGQTVTLRQFLDLQPADVATAIVRDGKFSFSGSTPYPEFSMLFVGDRGPLQFFVENADIRILVDVENLANSQVIGSPETDIFMEFLRRMESFNAQQNQLNEAYVAMSTAGTLTQEAIMGLRMQLQRLNEARIAYMNDFVMLNSGKIVSAFVICAVMQMQFYIPQMETVANSFDAVAGQSQWVKMISNHVASVRRTEVGRQFADITLKTPDDKPVSISDFAGKGKYVLLDFWAGWCGPCRVANPHLVRIYERYKDKGFEIVGISLDDSKDIWVRAIRDDNLTWPQMSDLKRFSSDAATLYAVNSIPHMILLDKDGIIIERGMSVGVLEAILAEIFD